MGNWEDYDVGEGIGFLKYMNPIAYAASSVGKGLVGYVREQPKEADAAKAVAKLFDLLFKQYGRNPTKPLMNRIMNVYNIANTEGPIRALPQVQSLYEEVNRAAPKPPPPTRIIISKTKKKSGKKPKAASAPATPETSDQSSDQSSDDGGPGPGDPGPSKGKGPKKTKTKSTRSGRKY